MKAGELQMRAGIIQVIHHHPCPAQVRLVQDGILVLSLISIILIRTRTPAPIRRHFPNHLFPQYPNLNPGGIQLILEWSSKFQGHVVLGRGKCWCEYRL